MESFNSGIIYFNPSAAILWMAYQFDTLTLTYCEIPDNPPLTRKAKQYIVVCRDNLKLNGVLKW